MLHLCIGVYNLRSAYSMNIDVWNMGINMCLCNSYTCVFVLFSAQLELPWPIPWNSLESYLGCTSRIYFDRVVLTLHNAMLTSQKSCQHNNKCDAVKQTVINEGYVISIKYRKSYFYWKNISFIYSADKMFRVIKIMDFNRADHTCYRTNFPYASSG